MVPSCGPQQLQLPSSMAALPLERWQSLTVRTWLRKRLCSMVAAMRGARSVLATDISMDALAHY